jgi:phosphate:Na+ symporter
MQSSTVVSVMLVGFVSTNVMTFKQSVPVLLGIQIGCTIVTQIIAFASTTTALFIIASGFWIWNLSKQPRIGYYGSLLLGAGLMMYGNQLLSRSIRNLKDYDPFIQFLASINSSIVGILCGTKKEFI